MHSSRYPCCVCGSPTDGDDGYAVCDDCADEYGIWPEASLMATARIVAWPDGEDAACTTVPLSPDEVEARLRHLLDDW